MVDIKVALDTLSVQQVEATKGMLGFMGQISQLRKNTNHLLEIIGSGTGSIPPPMEKDKLLDNLEKSRGI